MYIYYILLLFLLLVHIFTENSIKFKNKRYTQSLLCGLSIFLVMGLRHRTVGVDMEHYLNIYEEQLYFRNIFNQFEFGYFLFTALLSKIGFSSQGLIITTSFIISLSFTVFFYRYSKNIPYSFFLHLTIGLFMVSLSALRQTLAISILLFSIPYVIKRNHFKVILITLLASTFHKSALFFLVIYGLSFFKFNSYFKLLLPIFLSLIIILFRTKIAHTVEFFIPKKYITIYGLINEEHKLNILLYIIDYAIYFFIVIGWTLSKKNLKQISKVDNLLFTMVSIIIMSTGLVLNLAMISRLNYYSLPAYIILIPNILTELKMTYITRKILILGLSLVCIVFFVMGSIDGILEIDNYFFFFCHN